MNVPIVSTQAPARLVLADVPRVHFYEGGKRCPEDIILPSVIRACLEYMGEKDYGCKHCLAQNPDCKIFCSYSYLAGISGAAFYLSWKEGWHMDNSAIFYMSDDPAAPERHIFDAVGYQHTWIEKQDGQDNEALFRQQIIENIQKGRPVIAYGIIGPPEACIVTGYDENGDVLIGWNFFQNFPEFSTGVEFEPSGYFRKRGWFEDTHCLLVIGDKKEKPPLGQTYRDALPWALKVIRTPMAMTGPDTPEWYKNRHNGQAAYTAWAEHMLRDDQFPANDETALRDHFNVHNNSTGNVAEGRWYGSQFLIEMTNHVHYALVADLLHAAACYATQHDLMWKVWDLAGGNGNPEGYKYMTDPQVRRKIADVILQARAEEEQAAAYLEQATQINK